MKIATNIKTDDWIRIISRLKTEHWKVASHYDGFDAGIDFDFLILRKNNEEIIFGWDNLDEGEIQCEENLMNELSGQFGIKFVFGSTPNLKHSASWLAKIQALKR